MGGVAIGAAKWLLNRPPRPKDSREDEEQYLKEWSKRHGKMKRKNRKEMFAGPITERIYYGKLWEHKWNRKREDVTETAIRAVFDLFKYKFENSCRPDGEYTFEFPGEDYVLSMRKKNTEVLEKTEKSKVCPRCGTKVQM